MVFQSYIYEPSNKKENAEFNDVLMIIGAIIIFIFIYIFLFSGVLAIISFGSVIFTLISIKINENRKKGVNRVGYLSFKMILTPDLLVIGDKKYRISELNNLQIIAKDYIGRTANILRTEHGINNYIKFLYKGVELSYQFQIIRRSDTMLIKEIRAQNKNIAVST